MHLRSGTTYNYTNDSNNVYETSDYDYEYYATLGRNFNTWKANVNRICLRETNLGCDDLPDMDYYSYFVEGVTFQRMAALLLRGLYYNIMN